MRVSVDVISPGHVTVKYNVYLHSFIHHTRSSASWILARIGPPTDMWHPQKHQKLDLQLHGLASELGRSFLVRLVFGLFQAGCSTDLLLGHAVGTAFGRAHKGSRLGRRAAGTALKHTGPRFRRGAAHRVIISDWLAILLSASSPA